MCDTKSLQVCSFSIILTSPGSLNLSSLLLFYIISTDILNVSPWFHAPPPWFLTFLYFHPDSPHPHADSLHPHSHPIPCILHFRTSEQMPTYEKLNLLPIKSIYLVFSSRERQRRLIQTKVYYKIVYSVCKETFHKPLKVTAAKKSMYMIDKTSISLFFSCNNWKTLFFMQIYHYPAVWCNRHVAAFFDISILKQVCILCPLSPKNTSMRSLNGC